MQINLKCPHCSITEDYDVSEVFVNEAFVLCCKCYSIIPVSMEWVQIEEGSSTKLTSGQVSPFKNGESVIIDNAEHPWYSQIALVCGNKHKFVRIELFGKRIWMPNEWIKQYNNPDE